MPYRAIGRRISVISKSSMEFGIIPRDFWYQPSWIDEEKATAARKQMEADNVIYGGVLFLITRFKCTLCDISGSLSYRNMCRFNSGVRGIPFDLWELMPDHE